MKRLFTVALLALFLICACVSAEAGMKAGMKGMGKQGMMRGHGLEGTFYKQADVMLDNREELGLSDDQVREIRDLMSETRKTVIQLDAKIATLKVEIDTLMWEVPFNVDAVNSLAAQKYDLKEQKARLLVGSHDKLYKLLNKDQLEKLKKL